MKKILDFIKSNILVAKWTIWYFFVLWLILQFVFKFNPFSAHYWWKFFHATLHGFPGFVFGLLIYTAIPIYLATTAIIYRKKELIIKIAFVDKVFAFVSKLFPKKDNVIIYLPTNTVGKYRLRGYYENFNKRKICFKSYD